MKTITFKKCRRGLSLVEVSVSTLLMGFLLTASMKSMNQISISSRTAQDRIKAQSLAEGLMAEILQQSYKDPTQTPTFGLESGEAASPGRTGFDDVDDYTFLLESSPKNRNGTTIANLTGWTRTTTIVYLSPSDYTTTSSTDQNVKRITVTVKKGTQTLYQLISIKTNGWNDLQYNGVSTISN
jgi:Tfp pilus assembly protein PilV